MACRPPAPFHSGLIWIGASLISLVPTLFRAIPPPLMCVEFPKLCVFNLPGVGSSCSFTSPGVVEGGLPFSLLVGSPEYSSHRTVVEAAS